MLVAVIGSLTVLPALLAKLGDRVDVGTASLPAARTASRGSGGRRCVPRCAIRRSPWSAPSRFCSRSRHRRCTCTRATTAFRTLRRTCPSRRRTTQVTKAFGTTSAPAVVVVHAPNLDAPSVRVRARRVRARDVHRPVKTIRHADNTVGARRPARRRRRRRSVDACTAHASLADHPVDDRRGAGRRRSR